MQFSQAVRWRWTYHEYEIIKFQRLDAKKTSKNTPRFVFKNLALVTFVFIWCPFKQKMEKNNRQSLRYLKTDRRMDQPTGVITVSQQEKSRKAGNAPWIFIHIIDIIQHFSMLQPLATNNFSNLWCTAPIDNYIKIGKADTKTTCTIPQKNKN